MFYLHKILCTFVRFFRMPAIVFLLHIIKLNGQIINKLNHYLIYYERKKSTGNRQIF